MTTAQGQVRALLAERTATSADDWHLVLKARYGMARVFEAVAARRPGAEVLTQALTCATAVHPIVMAGLVPRYAEIDAATMSIDPAKAELTARTAAVVIQHTFGFQAADAAARIAGTARQAGVLVIEDSAHCAGRIVRGPDGEAVADVSIHSFGVEKVLPTKFGGAVWVNPRMADAQARAAIVAALGELAKPGPLLRFAVRTYRLQVAVLNRLPGSLSRPLRSFLVAARLFEPPIERAETRAQRGRTPIEITGFAAKTAADALATLDTVERRRSEAAAVYAAALADLAPLAMPAADAQPLARFPVLAAGSERTADVVAGLRSQGVFAGTWYRPMLFPGVEDPAAYGLDPADPALSVTRDVVSRIVNLPTDVSRERATEIARIAAALIG